MRTDLAAPITVACDDSELASADSDVDSRRESDEVSPLMRAQRTAGLHRMAREGGRPHCAACDQCWPCEPAVYARTVMREWRESSETTEN